MFSTSHLMRAKDWEKIKHFSPAEFRYPNKMGLEFMQWLDNLREEAGVPMVITSSYRTPAYNRAIGGAKDSAHTDIPCNAVDIGERPRDDDPNWNYTRFKIVLTAMLHGCTRIGMYQNGSLHLDMTHDTRPAERLWRVVGNIV